MARTEKTEKAVYIFKSSFKNLFLFKENIQFKDHIYKTSDEKEAQTLRGKNGITEIKQEIEE